MLTLCILSAVRAIYVCKKVCPANLFCQKNIWKRQIIHALVGIVENILAVQTNNQSNELDIFFVARKFDSSIFVPNKLKNGRGA